MVWVRCCGSEVGDHFLAEAVVPVANDDVGAVDGPVLGEGGADTRRPACYEDGEAFDGGRVDGLREVDRGRLNAV